MKENQNDLAKNELHDAPSTEPTTNDTNSSGSLKKLLGDKKNWLFILCILIVLSITGALVLNRNLNSQTANQPTPTPTTAEVFPTSVPTSNEGIKWSDSAEKMSSDSFQSINSAVTDTLNSGDTTTEKPTLLSVDYYKVGIWQSGKFKGQNVIDAIISVRYPEGQAGPYTQQSILRFTLLNKKLHIFPGSNAIDITTNLGKYSDLVIENTKLPDLISDYQLSYAATQEMKFDVKYNGQTKTLTLSDYNYPDVFYASPKDGYKYFATFNQGQKLYGKRQGSAIPWANLQNKPYYVEDADHSADGITSGDSFPVYGSLEKINWIKPPDLMSNIQGYHNDYDPKINDVSSIPYSSSFGIACKQIPLSDLAGNSAINVNDVEKVGTFGEYQLYRPTNSDSVLQQMYQTIMDQANKYPETKFDMSFDQYMKSYPLLVAKDKFGEYQAFFRYDFPGHSEGCGKPVIYLYPKTKTQVRVNFDSSLHLTKTEPAYENGWDVTAYPDGKLVNLDGKTYPYLFWEGNTSNNFPADNGASVVKKSDVKQYLNQTLTDYGLNQKERGDFISYWLPYLNDKPYYQISFYTTSDLAKTIPEFISPKPESVLRILMKYKGLDKPIKVNPQPQPIPFERKGFTVVEWGGIYE